MSSNHSLPLSGSSWEGIVMTGKRVLVKTGKYRGQHGIIKERPFLSMTKGALSTSGKFNIIMSDGETIILSLVDEDFVVVDAEEATNENSNVNLGGNMNDMFEDIVNQAAFTLIEEKNIVEFRLLPTDQVIQICKPVMECLKGPMLKLIQEELLVLQSIVDGKEEESRVKAEKELKKYEELECTLVQKREEELKMRQKLLEELSKTQKELEKTIKKSTELKAQALKMQNESVAVQGRQEDLVKAVQKEQEELKKEIKLHKCVFNEQLEEKHKEIKKEREELKKTQEILYSRENKVLEQAARITSLEARVCAEGQAFVTFQAALQLAANH